MENCPIKSQIWLIFGTRQATSNSAGKYFVIVAPEVNVQTKRCQSSVVDLKLIFSVFENDQRVD